MLNMSGKSQLFLILLFTKLVLVGQPNTEIDKLNLLERFELFTDRTIYTIGESINFFAVDVSGVNNSTLSYSNVVYSELISFDGTVMVQDKFPLNGAIASGLIKIPDGVQSGVYYLKIYTRFMRNYGPSVYTYQPITVLNYKTREIIQKPHNYSPDFYLDTVFKKESIHRLIDLKNNSISNREKQNVFLSTKDENDLKGAVVFVVPEFLYSNAYIKVVAKYSPGKVKAQFFPETRGVSLSGILFDNQSRLPVPYGGVNLSFMGLQRFSLAVLSDSLGRFFFSLPELRGRNELLITSTYKNSLSINVDNDFCSEPVKLPFISLLSDKESKQFLVDLIKRSVVNQQYDSRKTESTESAIPNFEVYYEEPSHCIVMSEYIPLPTLKDYFYELIPQASIRTDNAKPTIQVLGAAADLLVYPPLVLIDNIIVTEIDKLLEVSPKRIERIEILNKPYIKGDLTYGGIVNIFSKEGDLAGMELPKSGLFFNYQLFSEQQAFNYDQPVPKNEPIMRNTLYWKVFDSDTENFSELTFNAGDLSGKYMVQLYGITPDGEVISDTALFIVK